MKYPDDDHLLGLVIVLVLVLWAAVSFAGGLEQSPGPRLPDDPDQLTWTWQQHTWALVHQFADAFVPIIALALAGAGGALWNKKKNATDR